MIVYLVHGFNVKDGGERTVDRLRPLLTDRGYLVREVDYGRFGLGRVRLCNKSVSRLLAKLVAPGSIAIGHSNGAAIIRQAAKYGAQFRHVTLITPALNREASIPHAGSVHVWHSTSDVATLASRFLFFHPWGAQGRYGYDGLDKRYTNYNLDAIFDAQVGHSGLFRRTGWMRGVLDQIP